MSDEPAGIVESEIDPANQFVMSVMAMVETRLLVSRKNHGTDEIVSEYMVMRLPLGASDEDIAAAQDQATRQRSALWDGLFGPAVAPGGDGSSAAGGDPVVAQQQQMQAAPAPAPRPTNGGGGGQDPYTVVIKFGKHNGRTLGEVLRMEPPGGKRPGYVEWLAETTNNEYLRKQAQAALAKYQREGLPPAPAEEEIELPF